MSEFLHIDPMPAALPLIEQIETASRQALRCHIHFGLWRLTAGIDGRKLHHGVLDDHWEHLRFLEHGQLFTAVVELHSLLDADKATINLPHLVKALELKKGSKPHLRKALSDAQPAFKRLRILRNAVYAHRTKKRSYADVFKAAQITPNQLQELVLACIKVSNELRVEVGLNAQVPSSRPMETYHRMLAQLAT
jgi:hypothetical protein